METILCPSSWGRVILMLTPKYEVDRTTRYWVITLFIWLRSVTVILTFYLIVMPLQFELDTSYRSRVTTTKIFHWSRAWSPNFYILERQRDVHFKFQLSNPQKALPWRKGCINTFCAWGCVQKCDLCVWRNNEKKESVMRQTGYSSSHPRRHSPLKFFLCGVESGR